MSRETSSQPLVTASEPRPVTPEGAQPLDPDAARPNESAKSDSNLDLDGPTRNGEAEAPHFAQLDTRMSWPIL
jgi:hypothetical protein